MRVCIYMYICIHAPMDYGSLNPCVYLLTKLERTTLNTRGLRGPVPQLCKRQHRRARNEPSSCRRHLLPVRLEGAVPITDGRRASGLGLGVSVYRLTGDRDHGYEGDISTGCSFFHKLQTDFTCFSLRSCPVVITVVVVETVAAKTQALQRTVGLLPPPYQRRRMNFLFLLLASISTAAAEVVVPITAACAGAVATIAVALENLTAAAARVTVRVCRRPRVAVDAEAARNPTTSRLPLR